MTQNEQIIKTLKHRLNGMSTEAATLGRYGLKQKVEEIGYLIDMLEKNIDRV
tara:strand:- start:1297 stop:1452 length:156 start_codon:yes stop_codon:yes gene_type:complete